MNALTRLLDGMLAELVDRMPQPPDHPTSDERWAALAEAPRCEACGELCDPAEGICRCAAGCPLLEAD